MINDARALHDELSALCSQGKIEEKRLEMHELSRFPSSIKRTTSKPLPEVLCKVPEKDSDQGGSHYVSVNRYLGRKTSSHRIMSDQLVFIGVQT